MKIIDKKAEKVLNFWFKQHNINDWFTTHNDFDTKVKTKFYDLHLKCHYG